MGYSESQIDYIIEQFKIVASLEDEKDKVAHLNQVTGSSDKDITWEVYSVYGQVVDAQKQDIEVAEIDIRNYLRKKRKNS